MANVILFRLVPKLRYLIEINIYNIVINLTQVYKKKLQNKIKILCVHTILNSMIDK